MLKQDQNKDQVTPPKVENEKGLKLNNNRCNRCRSRGLRDCECMKGAGGGGGGGAGDGKEETNADSNSSTVAAGTPSNAFQETYPHVISLLPTMVKETLVTLIDYEQVSHLFLFDINKSTLTFQAKSDLSPTEQAELQKFYDAIMVKFTEFKHVLENEKISVEDFKAEKTNDDNDLIIHIPNVAAFKQFIEYLIDNKLLSQEIVQQHVTKVALPTPKPSVTKPEEEEAFISSLKAGF